MQSAADPQRCSRAMDHAAIRRHWTSSAVSGVEAGVEWVVNDSLIGHF